MDDSKHLSGTIDLINDWIEQLYGMTPNSIKRLAGYEDLNFLIELKNGNKFIVKLSLDPGKYQDLAAQNLLLEFLQQHSNTPESFPAIQQGLDGNTIYQVNNNGNEFLMRVLSYLGGTLMKDQASSNTLLENLGTFLGAMNQSLQSCDIPELNKKRSPWDLQYATKCLEHIQDIQDPHYRRIAAYFMQQYQTQVQPVYPKLPMGLIHGDANDYNLLVDNERVTGLIDFGDACYSHLVHEPAIAITYLMMSSDDPLEAAAALISGYHRQRSLDPLELEILYYLVAARLCVSLSFSSHGQLVDPENKYIGIHQIPVKKLLDWLLATNPMAFHRRMKQACGFTTTQDVQIDELMSRRGRHFSKAMSISYQEPIPMNRGALQYLYDHSGNCYLDAVNNISHVGHCHPRVVAAAVEQMSILNTNTRYLYQILNEYAEHLFKYLPKQLSKLFLVNSGTEANELALRLARAHTGQHDMVVMEGAYHGHSTSTLEISPYKYRGKGGDGKPSFIHEFPIPYHNGHIPDTKDYLEEQQRILDNIIKDNGGIAGFIAESLLGCGGQVVLPDGYLKHSYEQIRKYQGVCIADEVQVGFGRVGTHFWGFETQGVIPDIVTMGKPMGNGHPLAAVVTTEEVASSFENGMEYFNSFGGNPVSCAIGNTVLSIIEDENLQGNALKVGNHLKQQFARMQTDWSLIGDVRGLGLFLGIEIIKEGQADQPDADMAKNIVEAMKNQGILLSTDGPYNNVIKIKPPLVFSIENANFLVNTFEEVITKLTSE